LNPSSCSIGRLFAFATLVVFPVCFFTIASAALPQITTAQAAYEQAIQLLQSGRAADALTVIDGAIMAGVRDPSLYNLKGLAASELGRDAEAEESFRTVIRLSPQSAMGYTNLGVLQSKLGRNQEAAVTFREALTHDLKSFTALLGLGESLEVVGKYDEAATWLQKASSVRPGDFQAAYDWAHSLLEARQPAAAKKALTQISAPSEPELALKYYSLAGVIAEAAQDAPEAARSYRQAYAIDPHSYEIYVALVRAALSPESESAKLDLPPAPENLSATQNLAIGLLFVSRDAYEEAIPPLEKTLQQDPFNDIATLNLVQAYKNVGKSAAAIDLAQRALKQRPSAGLHNLLGGLEEESGHYVEAVENYQRAVEIESTNEQYYFDLGMEYLSHFTFGPALEVYRVGTQKFPDSSRQYLGLAFSHYAIREYPAAADAFTKALEIDPDSPAVVKAWNTVLSFLTPNDWEALLPRLSRLQAAHPQSADLDFCYGVAIFRSEFAKGQKAAFERSQSLLEKSVKLRPDFPAAHLELGGLYAAQKQDQKAVDEYLEVIRQDPKSEIAHYRLGQLYRGMNKLDLATQELTRYQELSRLHEEELKRNRSAIQQFVLSQPAKQSNQ
jgi:tetratricopeptide (TPR) repeat protein